jgi:hypothetical protein
MFNTPQYDEDENFYIPSSPPSAVYTVDEDVLETGWTRRRILVALVAVILIVALIGTYLLPIIQAVEISEWLQGISRQIPILEPQMRT